MGRRENVRGLKVNVTKCGDPKCDAYFCKPEPSGAIGQTQLDRVEAKLDQLLARVPGPVSVAPPVKVIYKRPQK
jgi:hypothetical protein